MSSPSPQRRIEPRWPVALTIILVLGLLTVLPNRIRLVPVWVPYILGMTFLIAMATVPFSGGKARALRVERIILLIFCLIVGIGTLAGLSYLIYEMLYQSRELTGIELLTSSIAVWVLIILVFSLLYWQLDLGGPEARLDHRQGIPDWLFPQAELDNIMPNWRPTFVDYLFLSYNTATAFSPTDTLPLTTRAKLLLMLQSALSLATILVVVSRAINIIGS
jgi:uncharacterized membrane protein